MAGVREAWWPQQHCARRSVPLVFSTALLARTPAPPFTLLRPPAPPTHPAPQLSPRRRPPHDHPRRLCQAGARRGRPQHLPAQAVHRTDTVRGVCVWGCGGVGGWAGGCCGRIPSQFHRRLQYPPSTPPHRPCSPPPLPCRPRSRTCGACSTPSATSWSWRCCAARAAPRAVPSSPTPPAARPPPPSTPSTGARCVVGCRGGGLLHSWACSVAHALRVLWRRAAHPCSCCSSPPCHGPALAYLRAANPGAAPRARGGPSFFSSLSRLVV